ncbi:hypothetical protein QBC34DRAFT_385972 [Podospora aff. communis PSN243]|uniref:Uncharacterized protein n=1 Tax=Podospora aff. communis PSN243 TaxID=3040156 RepID=A0AAV9G6N1_9PEZI|nr:hypothetical protein QBC34DRAFT_385972 [Podospora aff. communis PSN243]
MPVLPETSLHLERATLGTLTILARDAPSVLSKGAAIAIYTVVGVFTVLGFVAAWVVPDWWKKRQALKMQAAETPTIPLEDRVEHYK